MPYFADRGPQSGPIPGRHDPEAIGVLESPDNHTPIGMALACGRGGGGIALWALTAHGVLVPGCWVVVDREFRPEEFADRHSPQT
jgi:hypothetical protein